MEREYVMKKILSEKGNLIARCIVFQIAMSLLGFFVLSAIANTNDTVILLGGIFTMLFYFALMGAFLNEDGLKDALILKRNNESIDAFYGMKYVAVSYIPTLLMTICIIIFRTFSFAFEAADFLVMIVKFFFSGMYIGIDMILFITGANEQGYAVYHIISSNGYSLLFYQLFSIVICGLFYYLGTKGVNLIKTKDKQ